MTSSAPVSTAPPLDAAALAAAFDAHGAAVYGLAHRITADADVAGRLTADAFKAVRRVATTHDGSLRACLLTEVHRRAVEWSRRHAPAQAQGAASTLEALSELADEERAVVADAYFAGKTYDEVAQERGITRSDVARMMQAALHRLGSTTPGSRRDTPSS